MQTPDTQIEQLRALGLSRIWLDVAEALGVDAFFELWKRLDDASDSPALPDQIIPG